MTGYQNPKYSKKEPKKPKGSYDYEELAWSLAKVLTDAENDVNGIVVYGKAAHRFGDKVSTIKSKLTPHRTLSAEDVIIILKDVAYAEYSKILPSVLRDMQRVYNDFNKDGFNKGKLTPKKLEELKHEVDKEIDDRTENVLELLDRYSKKK